MCFNPKVFFASGRACTVGYRPDSPPAVFKSFTPYNLQFQILEMGLFLQKLEKSLRLSTRAHVVDLPLDSGAVPPMRDQETHVAGGCGLSLSPEQQLLVDVLKQLYKIREEREKAEQHQRRSRAAASSYGRNVVEFLDEFVKYGPLSLVCGVVCVAVRCGA